LFLKEFPNNANDPFIKTSEVTPTYNCIAWAAGDSTQWYEPDPMGFYFWPRNIPRQYSVEAYVMVYESMGYKPCDNGAFENEFEKVAVFSKNGKPTHAARQLSDGKWTSKLGKNIDISHSIESMEGGQYGDVHQFLKRNRV